MKKENPDYSGWPVHVLIPAAGQSVRFGAKKPKQYQSINGKSLLRHTLEIFTGMQEIQSVRVIIDPTHAELYQEAVLGLDLPPPLYGGKDRKSSIYNGINEFLKVDFDSKILIHDAARPFTDRRHIEALIRALDTDEAATLAVPVTDTLRRKDNEETVDREGLWAVQTPQGFHAQTLFEAHRLFKDRTGFTDDASMVSAMGRKVTLVESARTNFKITTPEDWDLAKKMFGQAWEYRTGYGYDVHRFDDETPASSVRLGGVDIPFTRALKGHSDADVGLHALTDALLGAMGEGDIGTHFPPSDERWAGADSRIFIEKAVTLLQESCGRIVNVDLTFICERPKIGPHRDLMVEGLSSLLGIEKNRIGIKATTTEKLGFTGREEGIAAQALANIALPVQD